MVNGVHNNLHVDILLRFQNSLLLIHILPSLLEQEKENYALEYANE